MKIPAQVDYEEQGHCPVWPDGEPRKVRDTFNDILSEQDDAQKAGAR